MGKPKRLHPPPTPSIAEWEARLQRMAESTSTADSLGLRRYRRELRKYQSYLKQTLQEMKKND